MTTANTHMLGRAHAAGHSVLVVLGAGRVLAAAVRVARGVA